MYIGRGKHPHLIALALQSPNSGVIYVNGPQKMCGLNKARDGVRTTRKRGSVHNHMVGRMVMHG